MYRVTKELEFCFGHRLAEYQGKCRHLHGHNAKVALVMEVPELDKLGMAVDFSKIKKTMQKWVDETLDHKLLLQKGDPLCALLDKAGEVYHAIDYPPSTENLARMIFEKALSFEFPIVEVTVWETNVNSATYKP